MDDPTGQMDPLGRRQFFPMAGPQETTVFIVTSEITRFVRSRRRCGAARGSNGSPGQACEVFNHLAADWQIPA